MDHDYTNGIARSYGEVSYAQLKSGEIEVNGKKVKTAPLSSVVKARAIAEILKKDIRKVGFSSINQLNCCRMVRTKANIVLQSVAGFM